MSSRPSQPHARRLACLLGLSLATSASAANLLTNASFEVAGPAGSTVVSTGSSLVSVSAAADWYVFHNTPGTTTTSLVPTSIPLAGTTMLHVVTDGPSNGIEQVMGATGTGPACVHESVWLYIVSGTVLIGAGNGGSTGADTIVSTTGQWIQVTGTNSFCPANLFIIYSLSDGADFYVELASIEPYACIGPPGDLDLDGDVDAGDLAILLGAWGPCNGARCPADLNNDGGVGGGDLAILLANWGC